jgi:glycosyltransferase involved in cell wall biosynthesis
MNLINPLVSVVLPIHRDDKFTSAAVRSMLDQDFEDLELLLILSKKMESISAFQLNSKVRVLIAPTHWNLSQRLNFGISSSRGKYIARMDSDDISYSDRIRKQFLYMEENPDIDILGSGIRFIGQLAGNEKLINTVALLPSNNRELLFHMLNKNPFFHPTVMFRAESLKNSKLLYRRYFQRSQDYDLWTRASQKLKMANLEEPLLDYRLHSNQSGVIERRASVYYSNLAKFSYCIKSSFALDYRSLTAIRILPLRTRLLILSWFERRKNS